MPRLEPDTVLKATPWCVARTQKERYLIYNPRTDELHLFPVEAFHAYRLCDGMNSVRDIEDALAGMTGEGTVQVKQRVAGFLDGLLQRGIVEVCNGA